MHEGDVQSADAAGRVALSHMYACLGKGQSFRLEAGAGAGKTYSLVEALRWLIDKRGALLLRQNQQVGCITYTNVAKDEIVSRINAHPAVRPETVHSFCWAMLKDFQPLLRSLVPQLPTWSERLDEVDGIGTRCVHYEFGYPGINDNQILLRHDDVLLLMTQAMALSKFRSLLTCRYPILFIDEYQDTNASFILALKEWFLDRNEGPLIGLFGDHWQKIYGDGCGLIDHRTLEAIEKNANFRSAAPIVDVLNRMRPDLPQLVSDSSTPGEARVFHTNNWPGERLTGKGGGHWKDDTSAEAAQAYFDLVKTRLESEGWDMSKEKTKILMLSHSILARKQGYEGIRSVYGQYNDPWLKKEDPHIKFFADQLEPACTSFESKSYGEMFVALGGGRPCIRCHRDKVAWARTMDGLLVVRETGTIGEVIDFIASQKLIRLPSQVEEREVKLAKIGNTPSEDEPRSITQLRQLRLIPYAEMIALDRFIDGHTPFATKHGVKGAEFENVLVVIGRGWNKYNFVQTLEWMNYPPPADKQEFFESNRNLFYVVCSRPRVRLALLFTQFVTPAAMERLGVLFGEHCVIDLQPI